MSAEESRLEELILYLENTSPEDVLCDLSGKKPLPANVQLARSLVDVYNIPAGVVNVLLQYEHMRNNGEFVNNYVERLASHWMSRKVSTVREALKITREEHDKYMRWSSVKTYKKELGNTAVLEARQRAIEVAVHIENMTDEELGKFVRNMFSIK